MQLTCYSTHSLAFESTQTYMVCMVGLFIQGRCSGGDESMSVSLRLGHL